MYKDAEWPKVKITAHFGAEDKTAVVVVQAGEGRLKEYARKSAFGKALELWRITEPQLASENESTSESGSNQENVQESVQEKEGA